MNKLSNNIEKFHMYKGANLLNKLGGSVNKVKKTITQSDLLTSSLYTREP